jgi:WhiB family redox-sensing transcriptional regulator
LPLAKPGVDRRKSHWCSYIGAIVGEEQPVTDIAHLLLGQPENRSWQRQANCMGVDPDLFFPERGASTREAKEVCRGCVVREDCLEFALVNSEKFGIWGGLSERERRRIRRRRSAERRGEVVGGTAS